MYKCTAIEEKNKFMLIVKIEYCVQQCLWQVTAPGMARRRHCIPEVVVATQRAGPEYEVLEGVELRVSAARN